jgi:hypothetical protein
MDGKTGLLWRYVVVAIFLCCAGAHSLCAQISAEQASESLRDLKGIAVDLADIDSVAESDGLKKFLLETDVVVRLNRNDIRILVDSAWEETPGHPYLLVSIRTLKVAESDMYIYSIFVELYQDVRMLREPSLNLGVKTWGVSVMGHVKTSSLMDEVGVSLMNLIDIFIEDYWSVNGS